MLAALAARSPDDAAARVHVRICDFGIALPCTLRAHEAYEHGETTTLGGRAAMTMTPGTGGGGGGVCGGRPFIAGVAQFCGSPGFFAPEVARVRHAARRGRRRRAAVRGGARAAIRRAPRRLVVDGRNDTRGLWRGGGVGVGVVCVSRGWRRADRAARWDPANDALGSGQRRSRVRRANILSKVGSSDPAEARACATDVPRGTLIGRHCLSPPRLPPAVSVFSLVAR